MPDRPKTPLKPKGIKIGPVPEPSIRELDNEVKEKLKTFLHSKEIHNELRKIIAAGRKSLVVEFEHLLKFDMGLAKNLSDRPDDFLGAAAAVLEGITKMSGMRLYVRGFDKSIEIHNIHAGDVGKFIQVEGILIRSSNPKPGIRTAVFRCLRCGEENRVLQTEETLKKPFLCENPNCGKKGPFLKESYEIYEWQILRIRENTTEGETFLDAVLKDDLVDGTWRSGLGSLVRANGILKVSSGKHGFHNVLDIKHLKVIRPELTSEDYVKIKELTKDPWVRNKIIQSIAPAIYGYDAVKEAIALQLFGSEPVDLSDGTRIRGDIHVLLTGDPGTAKSQILKWAANVAPRGLYISGMKATGAGLTAAAVRDEISDWALEAGALVIADGGLVSIDEFEKMRPEDLSAILESLEQQTVSVAKAGIVATLNTRAAVLAAASPKLGRFEKNLTIAQQVPLDPVSLSRFDLVFIMRDEPHADQDRNMAHHILKMQRPPTKVKPPLSTDFLRKIIIYARQNLDPKLDNKDVMKTIEDFFVDWRKAAKQGGAPLPITVRQLEAIVRLAKANARMRLSDCVTVEDANRAIMLIKRSLQEAGIDTKTGKPDIDVLMTGKAKSQRDKIRRVLDIIKELESQYGGAAPVEEIKRIAESEGIRPKFVEELIERERMRGHLYEPKKGTVTRSRV